MKLQPLLSDRPRAHQLFHRLVVPSIFGAVAGLALGANEAIYWVLQVLAAIGGVLAGTEHLGAKDGAIRGVVGGFLFGAFIVLLSEISGADPKADIGDPPAALAVVTAVAGALLGAAGGALRKRLEARG